MYLCFRRNYIWESRKNLHGHQFIAAIDHWKPFIYNITTKDNKISAVGLNWDVLKGLENMLNFTTLLVKGNDSWSEMVTKVNKKQLDFAVTGFSQVINQPYNRQTEIFEHPLDFWYMVRICILRRRSQITF